MASAETVGTILERKGGRLCCVQPSAPVYEALEMMAIHDIGAVLVMDESKLAGVFSERDYARKLVLHGKASRETPVGEIMTTRPLTVERSHTIDDCMRFMTEYHVRHLPVVEKGSILGVISIGDVVNALIRRQEQEIAHLQSYIAGSYPS